MMDFFEMLKTGRGKTALAQKIEREVERAKNHEEWRMEYMTLFMRDEEMKEEGRVEGRAEGVAGAILELLSELGPIPENIKNFIKYEKDLAVLNQLLKKAAKCKTIEEFRDFL